MQTSIQVPTNAQPIALKPQARSTNPGNHQGLGLYPAADLPIGIVRQGVQRVAARQGVLEQVM